MMSPHPPVALLAVGVLLTGLTACGGGDDDDIALSPLASEGREIIRGNGCAACHGRNGEGGTGPTFEELYGSEVELDDGTTVVADDAYLAESIREPQAKQVAGFPIKMPVNDLDDGQIEAVIAFIRELSAVGSESAGDIELSAAAAEGREISNSNGCGACHGVDGQGGLAGPYVGLIGSEIELTDGTTVVVDEAFVRESITDPSAAQNAAYELVMPANGLSADEVDAVVTYIAELSGVAE